MSKQDRDEKRNELEVIRQQYQSEKERNEARFRRFLERLAELDLFANTQD